MNVIFGKENLALIGDKYTALELDTLLIKESHEPIQHYAVIGPDELGLEGILKLKQMIPVHEALIKNYKEGNFDFCLQAIDKLKGNLGSFMDTFYDILASRIHKQMESPAEDWTYILDLT